MVVATMNNEGEVEGFVATLIFGASDHSSKNMQVGLTSQSE